MKKSGRFNVLIKTHKQQQTAQTSTVKKTRRKPAPARSAGQGSAEDTSLRTYVNLDPDDKIVTVGAKVPQSWQQHWAWRSKQERVTMSDVIIDALKARFGLPEKKS